MSSLYYNHGAMRLHANSPQICMLPSCSSVPYHQQDICCQRVSSSCSNQCASFSTSLWATLIRRRKNVLSYLFMTSFSILHSSFLHWGSARTAHSTATLKEGLILNSFLVILFKKKRNHHHYYFRFGPQDTERKVWWNQPFLLFLPM